MLLVSPHISPIEYRPRPITEEEKHTFIQWLQLDFAYELEGTNSIDRYAEIEQSLDSCYVAVFEHGMLEVSEKLIAVISTTSVQLYTFAKDGQFTLQGEYEQG